MSQPQPYDPSTNFTQYQIAHSTDPFNGSLFDTEFGNISITLTEVLANLELIQRDDGELANQSVTPESLSQPVLNMIGDWNPRGFWVAGTSYAVKDMVVFSPTSISYVCSTAHVASGTFNNDYLLGYWLPVADLSVAFPAASGVVFTPVGGISATNVQDAIAEVDAEAMKIAGGTFTGSVTVGSNLIVNGNTSLQNVTSGTWSAGTIAVTGTISATGRFLAPNGTASLPSYGFTNDLDTGFFRDAVGDRITVSIAGTARMALGNGGNDLLLGPNSRMTWASIPSSLVNEDLFVTRQGAGHLGVDNGGTATSTRFDVFRTFTDPSNNDGVQIFSGPGALSGIFATANGSGSFSSMSVGTLGGTQDLYFVSDGVQRWTVSGATGSLLGFSDGAYDIGAIGATRPRSLYLASRMVSGLTSLAYGTTIAYDASLSNDFVFTATNATTFTVDTPLSITTGQRVTMTIRNTSGGAINALFHTVYKQAALVQPATANSKSITWRYNGTNMVEVSRTTVDVPN